MIKRNIEKKIELGLDEKYAICFLIENFRNEEVKKFLFLPIDLNDKNENGMSYLHIAVNFENLEIVNFLIENGCDLNIKDKYGRSPLDFAIEDKNDKIIKVFIDWKCKTC